MTRTTAALATCAVTLALLTLVALAACGTGSSSGPSGADASIEDATAVVDASTVDAAFDAACSVGPLAPGDIELPAPTGAYGIVRGARRTFVDDSRDIDGNALQDGGAPDASRPLSVELWFPTDPCPPGVAVPYLDANEAKASNVTLAQVAQVHAHARAKLPFAGGLSPRPLLVFSHGYSELPRFYTSLFEELVSHGYVVAEITHTLWVPVATFADGSTIAGTHGSQNVSFAEYSASAPVWLADARFVLDRILELNGSDPGGEIQGHLDTSKIGALGHSFGGATAIGLVAADARVKGALDMDGTLFGPIVGQAIAQPIFFLQSDRGADSTLDTTFANATGMAYEATVKKALHQNFSDLALYPPFATQVSTLIGTIDPVRAIRIARAYQLAFFDDVLSGTASPLLAGPSTSYPEVVFKKRP